MCGCVCVRVWVGMCVGVWVRACVRACVFAIRLGHHPWWLGALCGEEKGWTEAQRSLAITSSENNSTAEIIIKDLVISTCGNNKNSNLSRQFAPPVARVQLSVFARTNSASTSTFVSVCGRKTTISCSRFSPPSSSVYRECQGGNEVF